MQVGNLDMKFYQAVGNKIREERKKRKIELKELAKIAALNNSTALYRY